MSQIKLTPKSFVVLLAVVATAFLAPVIVRATSNLVDDPATIWSGSSDGKSSGQDVYAEISTTQLNAQGFNNNLEATRSFAKLSYASASGNTYRIGYCDPNTAKGCYSSTSSSVSKSGQYNTEVIVCALNAQEDAIISGACQTYTRPASGTDLAISKQPQLSVKNKRYNYMAIVQFVGNNPAAAGYPIHPFRLRSSNNDGTAGFFAQQDLDPNNAVNQFVLGTTAQTPIAIQNRRASIGGTTINGTPTVHKDNLKLRFRVDCTLPGSNNSFKVKWSDADAKVGSSPYNPEINWVLVQYRDGSPISFKTSANYAGGGGATEENYLGGNNDGVHSQSVTPANFNSTGGIQANDVFEWSWNSVLATNGVQFNVPFDDANIIDDCPSTVSGTCAINITSPSSKVIVPGQSISGNITVSNTGSDPWSVLYPTTSTGGSYRLGSSTDNDEWGPGTKRFAIQPSVTGAFGPILESAKSSSTAITLVAPSTLAAGNADVTFRVLLEGVKDSNGNPKPGKQITSCPVSFKVKENRPFMRVNGNDVVSGATFGSGNLGSCSSTTFYDPADPKWGAINTSGYFSSDSNALAEFEGYSSSQYATFSSNEIGDSQNISNRNNFVANNGNTIDNGSGDAKDLLFANTNIPNGDYGHFYGADTQSIPCVDSSRIQKNLPTAITGAQTLSGLIATSGTFARYTGDLTISATTVASQKVLWVDGLVKVTGNITYDQTNGYGYNANGQPKVPYLMIIATGGIEVNKAVSTLDGNYISLPVVSKDGQVATLAGGATTTKSGRFDTCADAIAGAESNWPNGVTQNLTTTSCNVKLTVNGGIIARRILWKRTYGTLGQSDTVIDGACLVNDGTFADPYPGSYGDSTSAILRGFNARLEKCSGEYINFSPEAYFSPLTSTGGSTVDSVPTSTVELPPIY